AQVRDARAGFRSAVASKGAAESEQAPLHRSTPAPRDEALGFRAENGARQPAPRRRAEAPRRSADGAPRTSRQGRGGSTVKSCTLTLTALLCACASSTAVGPSFNTDWQNDAGASIAAVEQKLRGTPPPPTVNVAVGLTADALLGVPLDGGTPWKHPKTSDSPPVIAGDLVVFSSGGELFALDARTGERRWKIGVAGYRLRGAGDDGTVTVATLGQPDGARSLFVTVSRKGSVLEHQQTTHPLGRPAAQGGVAFVPWSGQYVSAIDMENGDEIGRLLTRELTSHALQENGELYFGEKGVIRFDERIK